MMPSLRSRPRRNNHDRRSHCAFNHWRALFIGVAFFMRGLTRWIFDRAASVRQIDIGALDCAVEEKGNKIMKAIRERNK